MPYSHKPYKRTDRLADEIKQVLAEILIKQVQITEADMLTVLKVSLSPDLMTANVYFSYLNDQKTPDEILNILKKKVKTIRYLMGKEIVVKNLPQIRFHYDDSMEKAEKIEQILYKLHKGEL